MKKSIFIHLVAVALISSGFEANSQGMTDNYAEKLYAVTARSGVILRKAPSSKSEMVLKIPYQKVVGVTQILENAPETFEGITAPWVKATFKGKSGFLFSGFLKEKEGMSVTFPGDKTGAGTDLFAVYTDPELGFFTSPLKDSQLIANGEMNKLLADSLNVLFLVGGLRSPGRLSGGAVGPISLLPGQKVEVNAGGDFIFCEGTPVVVGNELMISAYRLKFAKLGRHGVPKISTLYDHTLAGFHFNPEEPLTINWAGDLDGDSKPDLVMTYPEGNMLHRVLLISTMSESSQGLRKVVHTTIENL